jgi:hypothetical protein
LQAEIAATGLEAQASRVVAGMSANVRGAGLDPFALRGRTFTKRPRNSAVQAEFETHARPSPKSQVPARRLAQHRGQTANGCDLLSSAPPRRSAMSQK